MKKIFTLICLIIFLSSNISFAIEDITGKIEKKDPKLIKAPEDLKISKKAYEAKMAEDEKQYKKIKSEIGEEYYILYKIADKLIRANNFDTQNWRLTLVKKVNEVNAFSSSGNLVAIYSSLFDSLYGNEDAIAYVLGHEYSHLLLRHLKSGTETRYKIYDCDQARVLSTATPLGLIAVPSLLLLKFKYYKDLRKEEIQADTEAITLMARAGFDVEGAIDGLNFLEQQPELDLLTNDHPLAEKRLKNARKEIGNIDLESLKLQGASNLYNSDVLKVKISSDNKSIVLLPAQNKTKVNYTKLKPQDKILWSAYSYYKKDDMAQAEDLFKKAYKLDKKNYIPCLYLSYLNEYNYKQYDNKKSLKQARNWANKAYKKNSRDNNALKQKMEIEKLYKSLK